MLQLYDVVKLKKDDPEHGVKATYLGTVIDIHNNGEAYTVEFVDEGAETVEDALFTTYHEDQLTLVTAFEDLA